MSKPPISRFPTPELHDLPQDIRERIEAVQEKSGFVPNVFLALARRPDEFRAFFAYHDALMEKPGGLSKAEREMIVVATSGVNNCQYCVVAHGAILRIRAKNPLIADQVAVNYRKADLTPKQRAMLDFAVKVAERSHAIDDADYEQLKSHDFSDDDAWDIAAIAAMFAMSNRLANALSIRANDEFYVMGRKAGAERRQRLGQNRRELYVSLSSRVFSLRTGCWLLWERGEEQDTLGWNRPREEAEGRRGDPEQPPVALHLWIATPLRGSR